MYSTQSFSSHTKIQHPDYTNDVAVMYSNLKRIKGKLHDVNHKKAADSFAKALNLYDTLQNTNIENITKRELIAIIKKAL